MQITSTFVLAALFALKASTVLSAPVVRLLHLIYLVKHSNIKDRSQMTSSQSMPATALLTLRLCLRLVRMRTNLSLTPAILTMSSNSRARDFEDYELFEARGRFDRKVGAEQNIMSQEQQRIKAEQARLQNQQKDVSLQQQIHKDRQTLRHDNFGHPLPAPGAHRPGSRFQAKMGAEQLIMSNEQKALKSQEQRLQTQQKDMSLQQQMHKDRMALRKDMSSFGSPRFQHAQDSGNWLPCSHRKSHREQTPCPPSHWHSRRRWTPLARRQPSSIEVPKQDQFGGSHYAPRAAEDFPRGKASQAAAAGCRIAGADS